MTVESIKQAVGAAIQSASEATGVDFDFLMRTAKRESGYNPAAKAGSSSAAGLFQFVEQTWLGALKRHGAKYGYGDYASLIQGSGDRLSVSGGDAKKAVMALRLDPRASSMMAGELASENAAYLKGRVGREPTSGELYMAHFLGAKGSADLIETAQLRPAVPAASLFPEAASANPSIFYRDGRAASAGEVYSALTRGQSGAVATVQKAVDTNADDFIHTGKSRSSRQDQEKMLTDMILGMGRDSGARAFGLGGSDDAQGSGAKGLTGSLFTSEMLTLLSQARHEAASKT